jgi:hypothetical protein
LNKTALFRQLAPSHFLLLYGRDVLQKRPFYLFDSEVARDLRLTEGLGLEPSSLKRQVLTS